MRISRLGQDNLYRSLVIRVVRGFVLFFKRQEKERLAPFLSVKKKG